MADNSSDWADRSDLSLSSDEEDFVSSQSTASAEPDSLASQHLPAALSKLHVAEMGSTQSSDPRATSTSTTSTGVSTYATPIPKEERKKMNLLDLPLDVLKEIIKEVRVSLHVYGVLPCRSFMPMLMATTTLDHAHE